MSFVDWVQGFLGFDFDDDSAVDDQVCAKAAIQADCFVDQWNRPLAFRSQA